MMPGFLLRYVKRILHEKDTNAFMAAHGHNRGLDFAEKVFSEFGVKLKVKGLENIPEHGGVIIASNHPLGGFDGVAIMLAVAKKRHDIRFLVNDILMHIGSFGELFVPINKHGAQYATDRIDATYRSGHAVLIFPAGLVSRKQNGIIRDLEWKKSFISKAIRYQKPVIPVYVDGQNSSFFYNFALWRKRLGIKANIEMFYLVNEMYKQHNKTITITFGRPVSPDVFDKTRTHHQWAELMKQQVYALGEGKPGPFTDR